MLGITVQRRDHRTYSVTHWNKHSVVCCGRNKHFGCVSFQIWWAFQDWKSCTACLALSPDKEGHYQALESYYSSVQYIVVSYFSPWLIFCFPCVLHVLFFPSCWKSKIISIKGWGNNTKIVLITKMGSLKRNGFKKFLVFQLDFYACVYFKSFRDARILATKWDENSQIEHSSVLVFLSPLESQSCFSNLWESLQLPLSTYFCQLCWYICTLDERKQSEVTLCCLAPAK